ncbi:outer membrane lipoprotein chaperone LolA [Shewanella algae]|uniref:outer membrane lipoprotein chaperone LolA n=1 Tax=Shewanella algae TaxID=38313 RepID=UPI001AAD3375|nr:outer membrane lipoprotein chaperone LolA [Shewanella algae]MBO2586682.1 outer membrane lipoprotein chaperone LolA [Shewanella algae]MBO2628717.1 outer membrane lipoprotein chaperone LolA [Shewanella algae]MBO2637143.1 outer membrane lipoprotein chaperone LolA [Shewanella algae]MCE9778166.1 outer membrane lipoprotein chaperone LolA [Shewanella algae]MCE9826466.1 outer membrane lipoprotein chaperone LolA [Shewanella algae]
MNKSIMFLALAVSLPVMADDAGVLREKLDAIAGLKADFQQQVTDINGKLIQQGSGELALAQPNQFYWHLQQPDESVIVADGKDVWIYNPFAEEVSVLALENAIAASPMTLLVRRDEASWARYHIILDKECFQIAPKTEEAGVQQVSVCFNDNTLTRLALKDTQGNFSQFNLSEQQPLTDSDKRLFQFEVPEGVSIDDQRPGQEG